MSSLPQRRHSSPRHQDLDQFSAVGPSDPLISTFFSCRRSSPQASTASLVLEFFPRQQRAASEVSVTSTRVSLLMPKRIAKVFFVKMNESFRSATCPYKQTMLPHIERFFLALYFQEDKIIHNAQHKAFENGLKLFGAALIQQPNFFGRRRGDRGDRGDLERGSYPRSSRGRITCSYIIIGSF